MTGELLEGVITTLIYGVVSVGAQTEEIMRLIAEDIKETHPEVADLICKHRYVDDFGKGTKSKEHTAKLKKETEEVLSSINMKVKDWAENNEPPPQSLSDDGISVQFAGQTWFPEIDSFSLNIWTMLGQCLM